MAIKKLVFLLWLISLAISGLAHSRYAEMVGGEVRTEIELRQKR